MYGHDTNPELTVDVVRDGTMARLSLTLTKADFFWSYSEPKTVPDDYFLAHADKLWCGDFTLISCRPYYAVHYSEATVEFRSDRFRTIHATFTQSQDWTFYADSDEDCDLSALFFEETEEYAEFIRYVESRETVLSCESLQNWCEEEFAAEESGFDLYFRFVCCGTNHGVPYADFRGVGSPIFFCESPHERGVSEVLCNVQNRYVRSLPCPISIFEVTR